MTRTALASMALGLLVGAGIARAEPGDSMPRHARLLLPICQTLPFEEGELVSTLRVELLAHSVELRHARVAAGDADAANIVVDTPTCSGIDLTIRIDSPTLERSVSQTLDLGDRRLPERSRILALSIAELFRESWPELSAPEPPAEQAPAEESPWEAARQPAPPTVDEAALVSEAVDATLDELEERRRTAEESIHAIMVTAALTARSYPMAQGGLFGGQAGLSFRLSRAVPLRLEVDGGYGYGGGTATIGDIEVQAALFGFSLLFHAESPRTQGFIGPRLELGWAWSRGRPDDPDVTPGSLDGFVLAVALAGGARLRLSPRIWLLLEAQAGWVANALDPRAEGRRVGGISGLLLGLTIGIAVGL